MITGHSEAVGRARSAAGDGGGRIRDARLGDDSLGVVTRDRD
jgi:hypothetical protein